jgi:uncharacterized protein (TIGR00725 family)
MRTRLVAVVGSGGHLTPEETELAESLGEALARAGYGVVCGGLGGVMEAAARGAARGRGAARHPPIVGVLPSYDIETANGFLDVVIPTGMGHARNAIVAAAGEVVVCVAGGTGTLSEVGLARKIKRPVLALRGSGGTASLVGKVLPSVEAVSTVEEALRRIHALCQ